MQYLPTSQSLSYPNALSVEIVDSFFGTQVADPYRWLEEAQSEQSRSWVEAQNQLTETFVATPSRSIIKARLTELWNFPRQTPPDRRGDWYYSWRNDGLQNQSVLVRQASLEAESELVLDPNQLSSVDHISVNTCALSSDGNQLAYGLSRDGSDTETLYFRNLLIDEVLSDSLEGLHNSEVAWHPDGEGVFYNRYPEPTPDRPQHSCNQVWYHRLGTLQSEDELIYEDSSRPDLDFYPRVSEDGTYLVLHAHLGASWNNGLLIRAISGGAFTELVEPGQACFRFIDNDGPVLYIHTNFKAPRYRLIAIDLNKPQPDDWQVLLPEQEDTLETVQRAGGKFVTCWLKDAQHRLSIHDVKGQKLREIPLPAPGTVELRGRRDQRELFFSFGSFICPVTIYRYDLVTGALRLLQRSEACFDLRQYVTSQVFVPSKDGTLIPVFLVHQKGIAPDGSHPVLLKGYGGFGLSQLPKFEVERIPWLEAGGIYAVANLRGGAEYGEAWHEAGMRDKKQNVFDDFIAVGEWLIAEGWSHPDKLASIGDSNGGLLTAACLVQRPDLFGAVISQVPLIDMLRYHRFSVGRYWIPEYGCADSSEAEFKTLLAYSPLHNVRPVSYPPVLVMSAEQDDRVVPAHAKKFVATLQAQAQAINQTEKPLLLRVETKAGHGAGKPTAIRIEELADLYAFLFRVLGIS